MTNERSTQLELKRINEIYFLSSLMIKTVCLAFSWNLFLQLCTIFLEILIVLYSYITLISGDSAITAGDMAFTIFLFIYMCLLANDGSVLKLRVSTVKLITFI